MRMLIAYVYFYVYMFAFVSTFEYMNAFVHVCAYVLAIKIDFQTFLPFSLLFQLTKCMLLNMYKGEVSIRDSLLLPPFSSQVVK